MSQLNVTVRNEKGARRMEMKAFRKALFNWWVVLEEGMTRQYVEGPFLTERGAKQAINLAFHYIKDCRNDMMDDDDGDVGSPSYRRAVYGPDWQK